MAFRNATFSTLIILATLILFSGCSEREEVTVAPCSTLEADTALKAAEERLAASDISLTLEEPGDLITPQELIPDPQELGDAAKQANFEEAIAQLNITLSELEQLDGDCASSSISDRALIHLHLGFLYTFDAISRLLISDDPKETFIIDFNNDDPDNPWYIVDVSEEVHEELDAIEDPREYPLAFTVDERQAIIDAADLIDDAAVKPLESNIQPQFSSVDRQPYTGSAIWHFEKAASLFGEYEPDVMDTLDELNVFLEEMRAMLQENAEDEWGFIYIPPVR